MFVFILVSEPVFSQKKKKNSEPRAQGLRLRESEFYFTEGEKYFILEDYSKALLFYQKALEISPENATIHYKIAEVLSRSNRSEDQVRASLSIDTALKLEKENKYFYLLAATIYSNLARFDKAAQTYENMIHAIPGTEEYLYELAAVYQYDKKIDDAIKTYERAENIFGVNEISSLQRIRLYLENGKTKEAFTEGKKIIEAFPEEERYAMGLAEILSQKGQLAAGIKILEDFIKPGEENGNAKMLLAGLYRDTHRENDARKILTEVFDNTSVESGSKVIVLGAYNMELNQDKAKGTSDATKEKFVLTLYEKLEKLYPEESNVYIIGGDLYLTLNDNEKSMAAYEKAIQLGDVNFEVWQNLIYLETKLDLLDKVIKTSEDALELFPNQGMLYYFNGYGNYRKHNYQEAIASMEQAKKLMPGNKSLLEEINGLLGDSYHALKQYDKSDNAYEAVLASNPNNYGALNNYSYYLSLRKVNLEKAEKMSTQLIKNNPDNPTYLDTYAWVLYMREKYKDARKYIEKAINTGKANSEHFEHYGDILFKLGDTNGAVAQWEKARGLNANNEILNRKIANRKIYE